MTTQKLSAAQKQRNRRVSSYQQLVRPVACHYARLCREPLDDLIQVGLLGLLRAAELYSRSSGTPFEAFARPHVRGAILHYLRDVAPVMRLPRRLSERQQQLRQMRRDWLLLHGREPQPSEVCEGLGIGPEQLQQLVQAGQLASISPLDDRQLELISDTRAPLGPRVDERAIEALSQLAPPIREVVRQVVLEGRSYRVIACGMQVSPMTVQRRLHRGLAQLRQLLSSTTRLPDRAGSVAAAC
jgi:RNA polymerase sigma-B factor